MRDAARSIGAIVRRDARLALTQPLALVTRWFSPIVAVAGFYFVARFVDPHRSIAIDGRHTGYFAYVSVNLSFMLLQTTALGAISQTVRYDQLVGTLESIVATPTRAEVFVVGCGLWPVLVGIAQVVTTLGVAALWLGLDLHATDPASLLVFVILSTSTMGAIGVLAAAAVIAFKTVPPSNVLVGGVASLLAGTLFPIGLLPPPARVLSWCLPLTHALRGLRGAIAGDSIGALAADAGWLAVATIVLVPASLAVLNRAVGRARRDGTLAQY